MRADKRRSILAAASELITERGYSGINLDAVCERAACSKSAIYATFGGKNGLLLALVEEAAGTIAQAQHALHLPNLDVEAALRHYAGLVLERAFEPTQIAIVKAVVGADAKEPEPARCYADVALATAESALSQFLAAKTASGELKVADPQTAAQQFHGLVLGWELFAAVVDPGRALPDAARAARLDAAVKLFVAHYGPASDD